MSVHRAALIASMCWSCVGGAHDAGYADAGASPNASVDVMHPLDAAAQRPLARLVVARVVAAWCGTCQVLVDHTTRILEGEQAARVRYVDVLLADEDNAPATEESLVAWRTTHPSTATTTLQLGPERALFGTGHRPLPWIVVRREGSDEVVATLSNPSVAALRGTLEDALAVAHQPAGPLADERFDAFDQAIVGKMLLSSRPPPDPTNAVGDEPAAAALGRRLFVERAMSPGGVSCLGCHDPSLVFTDGKGVPPAGAGPGQRNVPSLVLASQARWQLWAGRADTLWAQALLPFEDPREFASSRLLVAHVVAERYRVPYEQLFGMLPALEDAQRFPAQGKPGDAAWDAMLSHDQQEVNRVFVNVGKSLAAFERGLRPLPSAFDKYLGGDLQALDGAQKDGLLAFLRAGCAQCHHGSRLTDDSFHTLRFPTGRRDGSPDPGRSVGLQSLAASEFRTRSAPAATPPDGAFKTPSLRGVAFTLPYGHGGAYGGLASVIEAHRTCGLPPGTAFTTGDCEPWVGDFAPAAGPRIETFLRALTLEVEGACCDE